MLLRTLYKRLVSFLVLPPFLAFSCQNLRFGLKMLLLHFLKNVGQRLTGCITNVCPNWPAFLAKISNSGILVDILVTNFLNMSGKRLIFCTKCLCGKNKKKLINFYRNRLIYIVGRAHTKSIFFCFTLCFDEIRRKRFQRTDPRNKF